MSRSVFQQLYELIKALQEQLIEEKRKFHRMEMDVRAEVCAEMAAQLVEIEETYKWEINHNNNGHIRGDQQADRGAEGKLGREEKGWRRRREEGAGEERNSSQPPTSLFSH